MVATIVGREQAIRLRRIPDHSIKVDYRVEVSRRANPVIHGFAVRLTGRACSNPSRHTT